MLFYSSYSFAEWRFSGMGGINVVKIFFISHFWVKVAICSSILMWL